MQEWMDVLKQLGAIFGGASVGGYAVYRKVKSDNKSDTLDGKATGLITSLENQLQREIEEKHKMSIVIERIATERNEAVSKVGGLTVHVQSLEKEVQKMGEELLAVERRNDELSKSMLNMTKHFDQLSQQMEQIQIRNDQLISMLESK